MGGKNHSKHSSYRKLDCGKVYTLLRLHKSGNDVTWALPAYIYHGDHQRS